MVYRYSMRHKPKRYGYRVVNYRMVDVLGICHLEKTGETGVKSLFLTLARTPSRIK